MTIVEALKRSKETGESFCSDYFIGWIKWKDDWTYRIPAEAMIADDWEVIKEQEIK